MTDTRAIETRTHGRYLVRPPATPGPWPLLVGFHGYGESAAIHLDALALIPGAERWLVVAVQGLHVFYTRKQAIVASWMTRQGRDEAIADNGNYVERVLDAVRAEYPVGETLVLAGFSQGGAMAYRAAIRRRTDGLIVLGADVPPDVAAQPAPLPRVLVGHGVDDEWYTAAKYQADIETLTSLGADVEGCEFAGGHEWTPAFYEAAGRLLQHAEQTRR